MQTSSDDLTASKERSTNAQTDVKPGEAPIAVDSPHAFTGYADQRHAAHSQAVINIEKVGPWLIMLTFALGVTLTAIVLILVYAPSYIDARIQAAVAQAEVRAQESMARSEATASLARTQALVALDKVEDLRVQLANHDIRIELDGH